MNIEQYINKQIKKYETAAKYYKYLTQTFLSEREQREIIDCVIESVKAQVKPEKIETIYDLAKLLNNNWEGSELSNESDINVEQLCKEKKWVILFPYSDDNLEARGFIYDEVGAWNGGYYKLLNKGDFYKDDNEDNTYHKASTPSIIYTEEDPDIEVNWCNEVYDDDTHKKFIWEYRVLTDKFPYAYFNIKGEDDEKDEIWAKCCIIDCSKIF